MERDEITAWLKDSALPSDTWTTDELQRDFEVLGFGYGFCAVRRKSDGAKGSLRFQHLPRFYYGFEEA